MEDIVNNYDIYDEVVSGALPDFFANFRLSEILMNPQWAVIMHDLVVGSIYALAIFIPLVLVYFVIRILFLRDM